jgi:hypothetical protein
MKAILKDFTKEKKAFIENKSRKAKEVQDKIVKK